MKNIVKNILITASAVGIAVILGGCSSSSSPSAGYSEKSEKPESVSYVKTHQKEDVKKVYAKMYQKNKKDGTKDSMGHIRFSETDSGLKMLVELKDVRSGVEYKLRVYDLVDCEKKEGKSKTCTKNDRYLDLPTIIGDKNKKIQDTYMLTNVSAKELKNAKISLHRDDDKGNDLKVGWGIIEEDIFF